MAKDPILGDAPVTLHYQEQQPQQIPQTEAPNPVQPAGGGMPVVILAGGKGTRLEEETKGTIPKPMMAIGDKPMLEHIMLIYSAQGFKTFIIAAGFLHEQIVEWAKENFGRLKGVADALIVENTGEDTQTAGRILRLREYLDGAPFMLTYGDGLADINLPMLQDHHRSLKQPGLRKPMVTLSAVHPPARFGNIRIENGRAIAFGEKTQSPIDWINGGFYIVEPAIFDLIPGDHSMFEYHILPSLAIQKRLGAYQHPGFFQMVDTRRDLGLVNRLWDAGDAPWQI